MKSTYTYAASLAGAVLLVALGVGLSLWAFRQIEESGAARKHTFIVLSGADGLLFTLVDADTGHLGYLFSGDDAYLKPYYTAQNNVHDQMEALRQLTTISAARQRLDLSLIHI